MIRKIEIVTNVLAECLNYLLISAVLMILFLNFMKQPPEIWRISVLIVIPLFYYLLREKCKNPVLFFVCHILPIVAVARWFGNNGYERALWTVVVVVFTLMSIRIQLMKKKKGMGALSSVGASGCVVVLYIFDIVTGEGAVQPHLVILLFIYLAASYLYDYFTQFSNYMDMNRRTAEDIPENVAFRTSFKMAAVFTGVSFLLIYLVTDRRLIDSIGAKIGAAILAFLRFIFSLLPEYVMEESAVNESQQELDMLFFEEPLQEGGLSILVRVAEYILAIIVVVVLVVMVICLLWGLVKLIRNAHWGSADKEKTETAEEKDKIEFLLSLDRKKKKTDEDLGLFWGRTYNGQIRRLYHKTLWQKYKVLQEEKTAKLIKESTPRECCQALFEQKEEAFLFATLYERARYGGKPCSQQEVKLMKQYAQILLGR